MVGQSEDTRHSTGSSTIGEGEAELMRRQRSQELGEPSEKQYKRAGMVGTTASGAGAAGATALIAKHDHEPRGWRDASVDDKHHVWSDHISGARRSALKVSQSNTTPSGLWLTAESLPPVHAHHRLALDLPPDLLGINLPPDRALSEPRNPPRLLRHRVQLVPQRPNDGHGAHASQPA